MQNDNQLNNLNFNEESINLREEIEKYAYHWKWFVISGFVAMVLAFLYLRYTPNQYEVATTILIDEEKGGSLSELSAFEDLGLLGGSKNSIDNEIELLKSRNLMERVVKDLGINVTYFTKGRVITSEVFSNKAPLKINFFTKDSIFYNRDTTFTIHVLSPSKFSLKDIEGVKQSEHVFGENINTEFGDITITPIDIEKLDVDSELIVKISPLKKVVDRYRTAIQIQPVNKNSSVIQINLKDAVKLKAEEIVDNLVKQYNKDAVEDKSLIAKNTNIFINNRLEIINKELLLVETGAEKFKTDNKLSDIASEATLVLESKTELEKSIIDLSTQLKLAEYVDEFLKSNKEDLIPANLGLADDGLSSSTLKYNELLLERNRILQSSSKINPVIVNLNTQISNLRTSISQSLVNFKSSINISLNQAKQQENRLASKISEVPRQEREYRDIIRQQQIIEALYLYLLQKREENAITLAVTLPNAKIIDKAYGSDIPVAPKRKIIYLAALLLGLIVPFGTLYILFLLDNKVHTRKDVEGVVKAPILGDIPKSKNEKKIVVSEADRDSTAESFRLLRTNINFMLSGVKSSTKTIFVTSTISGEGKTFVSINMASVLALANKKVLLIGADIRKPKISEYLEITSEKGLTHFLIDTSLKPSDVIHHRKDTNFDILHSGIIAPNPSELLMNGRFQEILDYAKSKYDYVIVDTAPVNLVVDTLLLGDQADLFIYVVRANYLDKRMLEVPKLMYNEKRLPNMAILVNNTDYEKGGYGYGYGYGYGHEEDLIPWWKKILRGKTNV